MITARTSIVQGPRPSGTRAPPCDRYCACPIVTQSASSSTSQLSSANWAVARPFPGDGRVASERRHGQAAHRIGYADRRRTAHHDAGAADREGHEVMHAGRQLSLDGDLARAWARGGRSPPGRTASSPPATPTSRTAREAARRNAGCAPPSCPRASRPPGPGRIPPTSTGRTRNFGMGWASDLGVALIRSAAERISAPSRPRYDGRDLEVLCLPLGEPGEVATVSRDRYGRGRSSLRCAGHPDLVGGRMRRPVQGEIGWAGVGLQVRDRRQQGDGTVTDVSRAARRRARRRRTAPAGLPGRGCQRNCCPGPGEPRTRRWPPPAGGPPSASPRRSCHRRDRGRAARTA